jgi:hypothetical protein
MNLDMQKALVTGSTSGIGRAIALKLARKGAEVIVQGRDADRGGTVVDEIRSAGGKARFLAADLEKVADVRRLATEAGAIDILVNNAGLALFGAIGLVSMLTHDAVMTMPPWVYWLDGRDAVAATITSHGTWEGCRAPVATASCLPRLNGQPAALAYVRMDDGRWVAVCMTVMTLAEDGRISAMDVFVLPQHFATWGHPYRSSDVSPDEGASLRARKRLSDHTRRFSVGTRRPRGRTRRLPGCTRRVSWAERASPVQGKRGVMDPAIEVRARYRAGHTVRQDGFVEPGIDVVRRCNPGRSGRQGRSHDRTARVFVLQIRGLTVVPIESLGR